MEDDGEFRNDKNQHQGVKRVRAEVEEEDELVDQDLAEAISGNQGEALETTATPSDDKRAKMTPVEGPHDNISERLGETSIDVNPNTSSTSRWKQEALVDPNAAFKQVKEVWNELALRDSCFADLFPSTTIEEIIQRATTNVIDFCSARPMSGNGASMLLTGVRGIGKTTLMQGLCRVLGELQGTKLVCVYHDYEIGDMLPLVELLSKAIQGRSEPDSPLPYDEASDNFLTCLGKAWHKGYRVAMFLDEIQTLYVDRRDPSYERCHAIVRDILALGKSPHHCFGVVSGSSVEMRELAYLHHPRAKANKYPNLNNNVYREFHLCPIRDKSELEALIAASPQPHEDATECFRHTGGVGRSVRVYLSNTASFATNDQTFKETLSSNLAFFALIGRLASNPDANPWSLVTLGWAEVRDIVQPRLAEGADLATSLAEWLNSGVLYRTKQGTYQVLVPHHLTSYRSFISSEDAPNEMLKGVILGLCFGWAQEPTPGHLMERHLCERLIANYHLWGVADEPPTAWRPKLNLESVAVAVAGLFFSPEPDTGLDGVFVLENADMEGTYEIHTLQVKCGLLDRMIMCGGAVAEKNSDDQKMRGILAKGHHGITNLLPVLAKHGIKKVSRITFTLFTTKKVHETAKKALLSGLEVGELKVEGHLRDQDVTLQLMDDELQRLIARKASSAARH